MENKNGNNNNNNNNGNYNYNANSNGGIDMYRQYWIGPYCASDGKSIHMGTFFDAGCSSKTQTGVYEAFHYGYPLPFESKPIVTLNDCISCLKVDNNNNNNSKCKHCVKDGREGAFLSICSNSAHKYYSCCSPCWTILPHTLIFLF